MDPRPLADRPPRAPRPPPLYIYRGAPPKRGPHCHTRARINVDPGRGARLADDALELLRSKQGRLEIQFARVRIPETIDVRYQPPARARAREEQRLRLPLPRGIATPTGDLLTQVQKAIRADITEKYGQMRGVYVCVCVCVCVGLSLC